MIRQGRHDLNALPQRDYPVQFTFRPPFGRQIGRLWFEDKAYFI